MARAVRIGLIGDFNPVHDTIIATGEAIAHSASELSLDVDVQRLPTLSLVGEGAEETLARCDGFWVAPGTPYDSVAGALAGIQFARLRNRPLIGT
jgi:CTP synthase (UTP-ammonia lyase)